MNSPYNGKFRVSQIFKGATHDGLDLVGVDSKEVHSTVNGIVEKAGWENALNHKQGFGLYVRIRKDDSVDKYYFGHLSQVKVAAGQAVNVGDIIGIEGSTGKSTGSHCHYCVRGNGSRSQIRDINAISGIPNKLGTYDDGYAAKLKAQQKAKKNVSEIAQEVIKGLWGNGAERKKKLTAAGYNYNEVQAEVEKHLNKSTASSKKTNEQIAREVIAGKWGNGTERQNKLRAAGYDPKEIQKLVNKLV